MLVGCQQLDTERVEVDLVAQSAAESLHGLRGVVAAASEAASTTAWSGGGRAGTGRPRSGWRRPRPARTAHQGSQVLDGRERSW
jgi:hypothetical protein